MWHLDQGTVAEGNSQSWQVDVTSWCTFNVCSIVQLECLNAFELLCGSAIYTLKWCFFPLFGLRVFLNSTYTQVVPRRAGCGSFQRIWTYNAKEHMCCCMDFKCCAQTLLCFQSWQFVYAMPIQEPFFMTTAVTSHMQHRCTGSLSCTCLSMSTVPPDNQQNLFQ